MDDEDEMLSEIEVEQAPPVVPIPAPVEPPVKRKRGRPPKNKPAGEFQDQRHWSYKHFHLLVARIYLF